MQVEPLTQRVVNHLYIGQRVDVNQFALPGRRRHKRRVQPEFHESVTVHPHVAARGEAFHQAFHGNLIDLRFKEHQLPGRSPGIASLDTPSRCVSRHGQPFVTATASGGQQNLILNAAIYASSTVPLGTTYAGNWTYTFNVNLDF